MSTRINVALSLLGVFVGAVLLAYVFAPRGRTWAILAVGLIAMAAYLVGLFQTKPKLRMQFRVRT